MHKIVSTKKVLALSLMVFIMFGMLLAGCGAGDPATSGSDTSTVKVTEPVQSDKAKEPVKISFWNFNYGDAAKYPKALEKLMEGFMAANPSIKVEAQMISWENWLQTLLTAVNSGSAPDASISPSTACVMFAKMGEALYIDSIVDAWKAENNPILDDFLPGTLDLFKYEGRTAGFPWLIGPRGIMYRTDVFEQLGITELPKTWDDFLKICRVIRDKTDYVPFSIPCLAQDGSHVSLHFMFSNDVGVLTKDKTVDFDTKNFREFLSFIETLYKEDLIPEGTAGYKMDDSLKLYYTGKAAMTFCQPFAQISSYPEMEKVSGVLPTFAGPSGSARGLKWDDGVMAFSKSKYPEEAKMFLKYYMENNLVLFTEGGSEFYPLRKSFFEDQHFQAKGYKLTIENVLPYAAAASWPNPYYDEVGKIDGERILAKYALEGIFEGKSFEEIISNLNKNIKDMME